ncbi:MAG: saccharopine dehydrogenase NADP-binding domain-containing protein [Polyangiaceae bacterium]|nr:saccharopine dehydrogenase NADP-binding domain-containing protein [Polyangiaceae bacterium]NUQ77068.1 saccharopine dehydrogenase NADP-binding domain-containing protein [Polyangiaceae bacterium]
MQGDRWMLYGANGFTGTLIAEEAVKRGHKPILAGRSAEKLRPLAEKLNLEMVAVDLNDARALEDAVKRVSLVFHAAGPFVHTSEPMLKACLAAKASYVDITGELPVFERTLSLDARAKQLGIALISGVGFDVIPSDCLAKYVASAVPEATSLDIAIAAVGSPSRGTAKTMLEMMPKGGFVRRNGALVSAEAPSETRLLRFPNGEKTVVAIPWGDLVTAYHTTGIPNITTFMAMPKAMARVNEVLDPILSRVLEIPAVLRAAQKLVERVAKGPSEADRETGRSMVWARATDKQGNFKEAWLDTVESYRLTAEGGVLAVEKIFEKGVLGATTPALAFGADFVLEIKTTRRLDSLD